MVVLIDKKRSIGQAAKEVGIQEYVIRFWETQFGDYIKPTIGNGKRRYFYDKDIKILKLIKKYLYDKGFTIKGLQKLFETENVEVDEEFDTKIDNKITELNTSNPYVKTYIETSKIDNNYKINNSNLKNNLKDLKTKLNIFYEKLKSI